MAVANINIFRITPSPRKQVAKNTPLPDDFKPTEWTVICGRGRECYNHVGNGRFRGMLESYQQAYIDAPTRTDKSMIVNEIVNNFRRVMPVGAFVKKNPKTLKWFDVGDQQARDKVGHAIREATAGKKAKKIQQASPASNVRRAASEGRTLTNVPIPHTFTKSISLPPPNVSSTLSLESVPQPNPSSDPSNKRSVSAPAMMEPVSMVDVLDDITTALGEARSKHTEFIEKRENDLTSAVPVNPIQAQEALRDSLRLSIDATMRSLLLDALDVDEVDCFLLDSGVYPEMRL